MIKLYLSFLLLVMSPLQLAAENEQKILSNSFEQVSSADSIAFDFELYMITTEENRAKNSYRGYVRKKDGNVLQIFQGKTTLVTAKAVVFLDHKKKLIRFNHRDNSSTSGNPASFFMDGKGWANELKEFEYDGKTENLYRFVRSNLPEVITEITIYISVDTGMLRRIDYTYNKDLTGGITNAVLKYIWHDQDVIDQVDFSLSQFIKFEEGIPKPSDVYSGFQLIFGKRNEK